MVGRRRLTETQGFRRLAGTLATAGLLAVISTVAELMDGPATAYSVSALAASIVFFVGNLFFLLRPRVTAWMRVSQALIILAIAFLATSFSDPSAWGPHLLAALSVALLIKYRGAQTVTQVLLLAGAALLVALLTVALRADANWAELATSLVTFVAGFAIVYFAFYEELVTAVRENHVLRETDARRVATVTNLRKGIAAATEQYEESLAKTEELASVVATLQQRLATLEYTDGTDDLSHYNLTNREIDVLLALVRTKGSNKEIAEDLGISPETVKTHLYRICNKVGVDTRVDLIDSFYWTNRT